MKQILVSTLLAGALTVAGCKKKAADIGSAQIPAVQVVAVEAKRQPVSETLSLVGSIAANEMVEIKSETDGTVEEILFREGQPVKQGDLLIRLDESKFAAAVAEAEANFKLSRTSYERNQQLYRDKLISQQEFDQAAAGFQANQASLDLKKRQLKDARIYAPFSGVAGSRVVSPGQVISKNTTLTWLVDLDPVKVEIPVPERSLGQLRNGQTLEMGVASFPGEKFTGEVYFIAPQLDTTTRTALVKARVSNKDHRLKPGMFANLDLTLKLNENAVVIPESAVMASGERMIVYIIDKDDNAQVRPVQLGVRLAGLVEVTSGLQGGERVIAEGLQKVRPGGKVKAAPAEKTSPPQQSQGKVQKAKDQEAASEAVVVAATRNR